MNLYPHGYSGEMERAWDSYANGIAEAFDVAPPNKNLPRGKGFAAGFAAGYRAGLAREDAKALRKIPALFRKTDPSTSVEAAAKVERQAGRLRVLILQHLREKDLNAREMASLIGVPRDSISPRLAPLVRRGLIRQVATRDGQAVYQLADTHTPT